MPVDSLFAFALQWGLAGVILFVSGAWIYYKERQWSAATANFAKLHKDEVADMQKEHREERTELVKTLGIQHTEALQTNREVAEALRGNTQAFTELSTLIRDRQ